MVSRRRSTGGARQLETACTVNSWPLLQCRVVQTFREVSSDMCKTSACGDKLMRDSLAVLLLSARTSYHSVEVSVSDTRGLAT